VDLISKEIKRNFDYNETDFFKKIKLSQKIKIKILKLYPFMFDFLKSAYFENATEISTEISEINKKAYAILLKLLLGLVKDLSQSLKVKLRLMWMLNASSLINILNY